MSDETSPEPATEATWPIPMDVRIAARRRLYHRIMAALHAAMAETGVTYAEIAERIGLSEREVRRAFWDEAYWSRKTGIDRLSDLALAMGREPMLKLTPRVQTGVER